MANHTKTNRKKTNSMFLTSIGIIIFFVIAFWNQPVYRSYTLHTDKIQNNIKLIHISDLHSSIYGKDQRKLIQKVSDHNPDIIVLTGDIVDNIEPEDGALLFVEGLTDRYPMYYVSGNHEHWHHDYKSVIKKLEDRGVIILENKYEEVNIKGETIVLAGIMDPDYYIKEQSEKAVRQSLETSDIKNKELVLKGLFTILLAHRPEYHKIYQEYPIDLVLSGHSHGGQARMPFFLNGIYSPGQGFFPEFAGGQYDFQTYQLIVSRGLSFNIRFPRVFNPPEIVVINVFGGER